MDIPVDTRPVRPDDVPTVLQTQHQQDGQVQREDDGHDAVARAPLVGRHPCASREAEPGCRRWRRSAVGHGSSPRCGSRPPCCASASFLIVQPTSRLYPFGPSSSESSDGGRPRHQAP